MLKLVLFAIPKKLLMNFIEKDRECKTCNIEGF